MKIYPAIDLMSEQCVRLEQGRFESPTIYSDDPVRMAIAFRSEGAEYLHVVDLDGAKAAMPKQTGMILRIIRESGLRVQIGGGIRSFKDAETLFQAGADRLVVGSLAFREPETFEKLIENFGAGGIIG